MAKVLKFKEVNSDVEKRLKEFDKLSLKFRAEVKKGKEKKAVLANPSKGIFKSISNFFTETSPKPIGVPVKR